jgi:glycosyltransferase involved in cell wall biosynthesis
VERYDKVSELYREYKKGVEDTRKTYEFIFVLDGDFQEAFEALKRLDADGGKLKIIKLAKGFGEATALTIGFDHSIGNIILTLPAYQQVEANEISKLVQTLDTSDMVVARRWPRKDSILNRIQSKIFHFFLTPLSGLKFHDIGCGVRVFKRKILEDVKIYSDQHRFLPYLAGQFGFKVVEQNVEQSQKDTSQRIYPFSTYMQRILDIISILFLLKFTKKPLRFFGIIGFTIFALGSFISLYLGFIRIFMGEGLADRPLMLLGVLLIVVGIQIFSIGLIGEIIIFIHAKEIKDYTIDQIVN